MASILMTDAYKFSMAEAGFPLRRETFYLSLRQGGPHYIPFNAQEMISKLLPSPSPSVYEKLAVADEYPYLSENGYSMGAAFRRVMEGPILYMIAAQPKDSWAFNNEPIFSVTGPSAFVSWLEPLVLQLHYRIQLATLAKTVGLSGLPSQEITCDQQKEIIEEIEEMTGGPMSAQKYDVRVNSEAYFDRVHKRAKELVEIVGDPSRIFEVGLRAATCMDQHLIALKACREAGITATSNVYGAKELGMKPVGTMGHEHVMRWGDDHTAFTAMRDRKGGPVSMLVDTYSTLLSGLPAALYLMAEDGGVHPHSIRFDSGNIMAQLLVGEEMAQKLNVRPIWIIEDGLTAEKTRRFELLREQLGIEPERVLYGYGGYLVDEYLFGEATTRLPRLTRNAVSAVWKLSSTDRLPVMKFGDGGKQSIPGEPVVWRKFVGATQWQSVIAQAGEDIPGAVKCAGASAIDLNGYSFRYRANVSGEQPFVYSPETQRLVDRLLKQRHRMMFTHFEERGDV